MNDKLQKDLGNSNIFWRRVAGAQQDLHQTPLA